MQSLGQGVRGIARRFGFDFYRHMAGGRRMPLRLKPIREVGLPSLDAHRAAPKVFDMDLEHCTSLAGFSYRSGGWNPHVATLEEFAADRSLGYEGSSLHRLLHTFVPETLQEIFLEDREEPMAPLFRLPAERRLYRYVWTLSPRLVAKADATSKGDLHGHHYFGPMPDERGRAQFHRLLDTFLSIEREGFDPERYGYPTGYFVADDSSYRFVVGAGNHRLAALKILGFSTVPVSLSRSHPAVIHRRDLPSWTVAEGGPFAPETAQALFEKFMTEDGSTKARNIGVLTR